MTEAILNEKKNGMKMLLKFLLGIVGGLVALVIMMGGFLRNGWLIALALIGVLNGIWSFIGLFGLRVLKPQEVLVLTLFDKYIGTLKSEGFYWVNPLCSAVNPAAGTVLNQSGDVKATRVMEANTMRISPKL